jgi:serine/threonine protein kinase/tetratricopeptide (TPR) repeat protein
VFAGSPMIGRTLGRYEITAKIGAGGMGEVYRARDMHLEREVALKVLAAGRLSDEAAHRRFRQEALTLSRLNHPNIAILYDFGAEDGVDFLTMELIPGMSLREKMAKGELLQHDMIGCGLQLADALVAAHAKGVIHRDLKPGNVMMTPEGRLKVLDFGLATLLRGTDDPDATLSSTTGVGTGAGTPRYMSPEQLRGQPADERSDIWSCGVILYEMAAGYLPFQGGTVAELSSAILSEPPKAPPPETPVSLRDIVLRCLAKDPAQRYQRAGELRAALEAVNSGFHTPLPMPQVWSGRRAVPAAIAALLLLAAGAWLMPHLLRRWKPPATHPTATRTRLAVLPLAGAENDTERAFGNGMIETLTTGLTQLTGAHSLDVIPASEIRDKRISTLQEAYQQLGVNLGLEMELRTSGDQMRVSYQLIDPGTHKLVGGDTITAPAADPFALEDKVAQSVLHALQIELNPDERKTMNAHGTQQPTAYDFYLRGRGYLQDYNKPDNLENAILELNHALQQDPNYASAYAGLGEAYWYKYKMTKNETWIARARSACVHSVALQEALASGHACQGLVLDGTGKYEEAQKEYEDAVQLDPSDESAVAGLAHVYEHLDRPDEAEKTFQRAIVLHPNSPEGYDLLGWFYFNRARYDQAADAFRHVIDLSPDGVSGYSNLGSVYVAQGRYEEALPVLERAQSILPTGIAFSNLGTAYFCLRRYSDAGQAFQKAVASDPQNYELWGNLGDACYWAPGMQPQAAEAYRRAITLGEEALHVNSRDGEVLGYVAQYRAMLGDEMEANQNISEALRLAPHDPQVWLSAAMVYCQFGRKDETFHAMRQSIAAGLPRSQLRDTPNFDTLRSDPRFQNLLSGT